MTAILKSDRPLLAPFSGVDRSPGLHLSEIIGDLLRTLGTTNYPDQDAATRNANFEKGFIWERLLSRAFADREPLRPDEVECDGILCSPDGLAYIDDIPTLVEYKCTRVSSSTLPTENLYWMMQARGYCTALGIDTVQFHILYLSGNYRDDRGPTYWTHLVQFTQTELDENWSAITNHAKAKGWL